MAKDSFNDLLSTLFSVKEISYETVEIFAWEDDVGAPINKLADFNNFNNNFYVVFYLTNVDSSMGSIPLRFDWFSFTCACKNGQCCNLYLSPDVFGFTAEKMLSNQEISEVKEDLEHKIRPIIQALFSLL